MRPPCLQVPSGPGNGETHETRHGDSNYGQCTEGDALRGAAPGTAPARHCETSRPLGITHRDGGHPGTLGKETKMMKGPMCTESKDAFNLKRQTEQPVTVVISCI